MQFNVYNSESGTGQIIDLDELVARITAFNTNSSFEMETLKAFAVMARTELARRINIYGGKGCEENSGYDLCTAPGHCLEYGLSTVPVSRQVYDAVNETKNLIILFQDRPIKPYFHYRCGGATENSENVIGNRITYIRRVLCTYCREVQDENAEKYFTVEEFEDILNTRIKKPEGVYYNISGVFEDIEVDDQGRINKIKIGSKTFKGTELMQTLQLNSTRFDYIPVKFLIKSIGTGHGLGLCQCGANEMAKRGKTYDEILKYYYTGIVISEMELPDADKPLKGRKIVLDAAYGGEECEDGRGIGGLREKDVNLDIVLKLRDLLVQNGAIVYLTRDSDKNMAMADRAKAANRLKPDFFLSVGQNSFPSSSASGTEVYYYRGDTEGEALAGLIMEALCGQLGVKNRGVRTAEFFILREVKVSSVMIQLLYITNKDDEERLAEEAFRFKAAEAVYDAVCRYYTSHQCK